MAPVIGAGWLVTAAASILVGASSPGHGPTPTDTTDALDRLIAEALEANPRVRAVRLRRDALDARVPRAGALPDPVLGAGLVNRPLADPFDTGVQMTMDQLRLSQALPWPGKRGHRTDAARAAARAGSAEARETELELAAAVAATYYELAYLDGARDIHESTRRLLRDFSSVARTRYEVGSGIQADLLRAQVAVATQRAEIRTLEERRSAANVRLLALLGRAVTDTLRPADLPPIGGPAPAVEELLARAVESRPTLRAARARVTAAEAVRAEARFADRPDFDVMVGYGRRSGFPDLATLSVGINLPVWGGSRIEPLRREREAELLQRRAETREILDETRARLGELHAAIEKTVDLAALYDTSILPQARAAVESTLSAYRVGRVEYTTLLESQMTLNRFELDRLRLVTEHHQARAEVDALTGRMPSPGTDR